MNPGPLFPFPNSDSCFLITQLYSLIYHLNPLVNLWYFQGFPVGSMVTNLPMQETQVQSLGGKDPGEGSGNPLQFSCLRNPMGRGAWQATVCGVSKSRTRLSDFTSLLQVLSSRVFVSVYDLLFSISTIMSMELKLVNEQEATKSLVKYPEFALGYL